MQRIVVRGKRNCAYQCHNDLFRKPITMEGDDDKSIRSFVNGENEVNEIEQRNITEIDHDFWDEVWKMSKKRWI